MGILTSLYRHPMNGEHTPENPVYLAIFLSSDGTFPWFVTGVKKLDDDRYRADIIGFKWGYLIPDVIRSNWYDDYQIAHETRSRIHTIAELEVKLRVALPTDWHSHFHLIWLERSSIYGVEAEDDDDGERADYLMVFGLNAQHVYDQLDEHYREQGRREYHIEQQFSVIAASGVHTLTY